MLIVDTGVLVATADRNDNDHQACRTLLETDDGPLIPKTEVDSSGCATMGTMPAFVALALPGGPAFVDESQRIWSNGDAVFPVEPGSRICTASYAPRSPKRPE